MMAAGLRILCIEDEPDLREDLVDVLQASECVVSTAGDGLEGLAMALGADFDLILCDVRLPKLDGIEVLRELRRQPGAAGQTPFLVLSAYDDPAIRTAAESLGTSGFLLKPVRYDQLMNLVNGVGTP